MNWDEVRVNLVGQVLCGLLERDTGWASKIFDEVFYKKLAKHAVSIVDATIEELKKNGKTI